MEIDGADKLLSRKQNFRAKVIENLLNIIVAMSMANPVVVSAKSQRLLPLLEKTELSDKSKLSVVAVVMANRMGTFFAKKDGKIDATIRTTLGKIDNRWSKFQIARHALCDWQLSSRL